MAPRFALGLACLLIPGVAVPLATASSADAASPVDTAPLHQLALEYLSAKNDLLVTGSGQDASGVTGSAPMTDAFRAVVADEVGVLTDRRDRLARSHEKYTGSHTHVTIGDVTATGDSLQAAVTEHTALDYAKVYGDEPDNTEYVLDHVVTFRSDGSGGWMLARDEVSSEDLLPVTTVGTTSSTEEESADLADASLAASLATGTGPSSASACGQLDACDATEPTSPAAKIPTATTVEVAYPDEPKGLPTSINAGNSAGATAASIPTGLNYQAMVNYAYKYWDIYNPNYRSFSNDCTNFISQALRAGGWDYDYGWYRSSNNWWYNSMNQTFTWAGAENWSRFAPRRTRALGNVYQMLPSDIMQMDFDRNSVMNHSLIATKKSSSGMVYFTEHTTDTKDRSMASIYSQYPNSWYYAYRT